MNHHDLNNEQLSDIRNELLGKNMMFDRLYIDQSRIKSVEQYKWKIEGDEYEKCKAHSTSQYVQSPRFEYANSGYSISFHFNFYGRICSDDKEYCGIFVELDEMPEDIKRIEIEVDIKCNEKKAYRHLIRDQQLTREKRRCGFRIFMTSALDKNECFEWTFGVKIFNVKITGNDDDTPIDAQADAELDDLFRTLSHFY